MGNKIPRSGTRVRAVFDALQDGKEHRWSELVAVYMYAKHPYSRKEYVSLTLGRILKKYALRARRGVYVKRDGVVHVLRHAGPEPKMDAMCGTCHRVYGDHYGDKWPAATDCPVVDSGGFIRRSNDNELRRYWSNTVVPEPVKNDGPRRSKFKAGDWVKVTSTDQGVEKAFKANGVVRGNAYRVSEIKNSLGEDLVHLEGCTGGWFDHHFTLMPKPSVQGSPEIEDMAWHHKFDAAYDAKIEHETEVAMLEARIEDLERAKWKRLEPHGFPTCTCGEHTWPFVKGDPNIISSVREMLLSDDGYCDGHYSDRICKSQPIYPDNKPAIVRSDLQKQIDVLQADAKELRKIIDNKIHYINQTEAKLVEVTERSHKRQQLIDDTAAENLTYQERLEAGKTAIDTARSMLADILVGSLNESARAIEELDAQLSGTYGVLDGTMD